MKPTPESIAARLMAPASTSALWTHDQVMALIIEAIREERGAAPRPALKGKT